jgi:hypothetical protein
MSSTWIIEFRKNADGKCINDIWNQNEVNELVEYQDQFGVYVQYDATEIKASISINGCYITDSQIVSDLFNFYKCPMKITFDKDNSTDSRILDINPLDVNYYPSQFEYEYDYEVEKMIAIVTGKELLELYSENNYNYSREERLVLLAKTMFDIHYSLHDATSLRDL